MSAGREALIWGAALIVLGLVIHFLGPILLPFVVGAGVAYLLDPVLERLTRAGMNRSMATALVLLLFFAGLAAAVVVLGPLVKTQIEELVARAPALVTRLEAALSPLISRLSAALTPADVAELKAAAGDFAGYALSYGGGLLRSIWSGGLALLNFLSLVFVTPVVAFYLLRDWDRIVTKLDSWLPRDHAGIIRILARESNDMISGFVRGVGTVCVVQAIFYGAALTLIGLKFGLVIGIGAGLISFIPFVGAAAGFVVAVGVAAVQFHSAGMVILTAGVFVAGQIIEGHFLTPRIVGERIRLHPVWVIFALLAGGFLFAFLGVLLAVPVAAVIGVLVRFAVQRYLQSRLYLGHGGTLTSLPDERSRDP